MVGKGIRGFDDEQELRRDGMKEQGKEQHTSAKRCSPFHAISFILTSLVSLQQEKKKKSFHQEK